MKKTRPQNDRKPYNQSLKILNIGAIHIEKMKPKSSDLPNNTRDPTGPAAANFDNVFLSFQNQDGSVSSNAPGGGN